MLESVLVLSIAINSSGLLFVDAFYLTCANCLGWIILLIFDKLYIQALDYFVLSLFEIIRCYRRWDLYINNFNSLVSLNFKKN